jgi:hypothetical protein
MLTETDPQTALFITTRMNKETKRYKPTAPFHSARGCKYKFCLWHPRKSK